MRARIASYSAGLASRTRQPAIRAGHILQVPSSLPRAACLCALAPDSPADRLEIIVVSDGSMDRTEEIVRSFGDRVRLLALAGRNGKTMAQNRAVELATGEILLFSDATTVYGRDVVRTTVANFD